MSTDASKQTGDWNAASTWSDGVPKANAAVEITARKTVTLDQAAGHAATIAIDARGALDIEGETLTTTGGTTVDGELFGSGTLKGAVEGDGTVSLLEICRAQQSRLFSAEKFQPTPSVHPLANAEKSR